MQEGYQEVACVLPGDIAEALIYRQLKIGIRLRRNSYRQLSHTDALHVDDSDSDCGSEQRERSRFSETQPLKKQSHTLTNDGIIILGHNCD